MVNTLCLLEDLFLTFLTQTGNTRVTLNLRDYPNATQVSSTLGPFNITTSTT